MMEIVDKIDKALISKIKKELVVEIHKEVKKIKIDPEKAAGLLKKLDKIDDEELKNMVLFLIRASLEQSLLKRIE